MTEWAWFATGWGDFGRGDEDPPRLLPSAPVLCVGGPLHGKTSPYGAYTDELYAPVRPSRNAKSYREASLFVVEVPRTARYIFKRCWANLMVMPIPLWVLDSLSEADLRMWLGELGYYFGGLER